LTLARWKDRKRSTSARRCPTQDGRERTGETGRPRLFTSLVGQIEVAAYAGTRAPFLEESRTPWFCAAAHQSTDIGGNIASRPSQIRRREPPAFAPAFSRPVALDENVRVPRRSRLARQPLAYKLALEPRSMLAGSRAILRQRNRRRKRSSGQIADSRRTFCPHCFQFLALFT
jgi:hypothetical protein